MFAVQDILIFSLIAGVLAAAVLWVAWPWTRAGYRFLLAGATTIVGFMAWNFTLNATQAVPNFDVDAPVVGLSWADAGSGVFACLVTVLAFGLISDRDALASRVVGTAAIAGLVAMVLDLFVL